ncbi:MAG: methyltransferase domain-containing protein [Chloroflexota bacterium]|nr:methyltransferase domain-containing protein [Chloroflexota bacterium]
MPDILHFVSSSTERFRAPFPRIDRLELMDEKIEDMDELAENFRDIQRVNGLLGGTAIVLRHLPSLMAGIPAGRPVTILDLATGSADIPVAVVRWASRRKRDISIIASDYSPPILELARAQSAAYPEISLERFDARSVPLPDNYVDIVLCSLSLHHFDPDQAVRVLSEMHRLGRHGFILNDLRRGRLGFVGAWLASRVTTRNRLTRNDAPLSVRRAYTPPELTVLLDRAGIEDATISTHPWFRMAAVAAKERA